MAKETAITIGGIALMVATCTTPIYISQKVEEKREYNSAQVLWNEYRGNIQDYTVYIDEVIRRDSSKSNIINLEAISKDTRPYEITGHYGKEGIYRIFIMEEKLSGCNAVSFNSDHTTNWEPCPADEGKVKPFTQQQILDAEKQLYTALENFRKKEYQTRHWTAGMAEKENWGKLK